MAKVPDEVLRIVKQTRTWAETKGRERRFTPGLSGMCAIASAELYRRLATRGHKVRIGVAKGIRSHHVMVIYGGKYILDITATQFGHDEVEVRWFRNLIHPWYWKPKEFFDNDDELHVFQMSNKWSEHQWANGSRNYVV
jgi:hypothetical protein